MTPARAKALQVADMLPDLRLPSLDGCLVALRSEQGETTVLVWRHPFLCGECDRYARRLAELADDFRVWGARLLVLASPQCERQEAVAFGHVLETDLLPLQGAGVLVADRYGQIFYLVPAGDAHALPEERELLEWLKHLGTLCPE